MCLKSVLNAEKVKYFTSNVPRAKILSDLKEGEKKSFTAHPIHLRMSQKIS